ncbi:MAG TPA: cytochrome c [Terriglobales bacterium]|nr:cytochrome c [Terriglobales bacterium]
MKVVLMSAILLLLAGCAPPTRPVDAQRGKQIFDAGCAVCHYADRAATKVGPGLQGLFRSAKLPNGQKVSEKTVRDWIRNGDQKMPPFRKALTPEQIDDVVGFLKTL